MSRFNGSISEVLFYTKQIDPALWNGETNAYVFTRHLTQLPRRESWNQHISSQLHLECTYLLLHESIIAANRIG